MIDLQQLERESAAIGVELDGKTLDALSRYADMLLEWNAKMNLTAITKPEEIVTKHFVDSLTILRCVELEQGARVIDVGTGAGFPGVVLKLARPDIRLTLLDSLRKRVDFLRTLCAELEQDNVFLHSRAEDAGRLAEHREVYSLATARAVAQISVLCEYCLPFVKLGGVFAAMKGANVDEELSAAGQAIKKLGGKVDAVKPFSLADGSGRSIVCVKKISHISSKFPRSHDKMTKNPL